MHNVSSEQIVIIFIRIHKTAQSSCLKNKFIDGVAVESFIQKPSARYIWLKTYSKSLKD